MVVFYLEPPPKHVCSSGGPYEISNDFSKKVLMVDVTPLASLFFYVQLQWPTFIIDDIYPLQKKITQTIGRSVTSLLCYCCWAGSTPQLSWQETKAEQVSIFITADGRFYYLLFLSPSLLGMSQHCQLMTLSVPPVVLVRPPKALAPKAHGWGGGGLSIFVSSAKIRFHPRGFRGKKSEKRCKHKCDQCDKRI